MRFARKFSVCSLSTTEIASNWQNIVIYTYLKCHQLPSTDAFQFYNSLGGDDNASCNGNDNGVGQVQ